MTYDEAKSLPEFNEAYYLNCDERLAWGDRMLTRREFFERWERRNSPCDTLKKSST